MYLEDIVVACDHALLHIQGATEEQYLKARMLQAAVEREFQILAEALVQAIKLEPTIKLRITDADRITHFRNILVHAYDLVDHGRMWRTLKENVRTLRDESAKLLSERGG